MTGVDRASLRVALVDCHYPSDPVRQLAGALRGLGHEPTVLSCHRGRRRRHMDGGISVVQVRRLPERPLGWRGFEGPLTQVPFTVRALVAGGFDVVHAFSPTDALAGRLWRRVRGGPVVFSPLQEVRRESLANRRLRLKLIERAVERSDMVVAPSQETGDGLARWLATEAPVIEAGDADAHERLYRDLLERRP